jgi:hypothetical protein
MRGRSLAAAFVASVLAAPTSVAAAHRVTASAALARDGVVATVGEASATLTDGIVTRRWTWPRGHVQTVDLTGPGSPRSLLRPGPDFQLTAAGVTTSSLDHWTLLSARPVPPPALPDRPASGDGAAILFRFSLLDAATASVDVELDRLVVLHPRQAVFETTTTLISHGAALRVSAYTLDEVTAVDAAGRAQVQAYNGGSDWRDDYRHVSSPRGVFDVEGEVARFGAPAGFFLVAQRRGGLMSRVGRDAAGRCWVGVDWARDLFDWGPLRSSPPDYNRQSNPLYPLAVRARLLRPGATLDLGTSYLGVYAGGGAEAAATFARDFVVADEPAFARSVDVNTFHPWGHGAGMSDANLRKQVLVAKRLGVETFMLDDQWQGGAGGESGDWRFDPARFPDSDHDGRPDFVDFLHARGLQLGLWMSPLEFNPASKTYAAHPDWACAPTGDVTARIPDDAGLGVWDATNPAFRSYLLGVVDRLVRVDDVREFKFDFMAWVDCGAHDYADYEQAFVELVRAMQQRHPRVTFELDETNDQRAWPFESAALGPSWFDNGHLHGSGPVAKLLHDIWSAAPWVPAWSIGAGLYDGTLAGPYRGARGVDFLFPLAMLGHVTFWSDLRRLTQTQRRETAWWIRWYRAHRMSFGPAVYELTAHDPLDGRSWAAWQPWSGRRGYVMAFRQSGGPARLRLRLHAVVPGRRYAVTEVRTGRRVAVWPGRRLRAGLPVALSRFHAEVLSIRPV